MKKQKLSVLKIASYEICLAPKAVTIKVDYTMFKATCARNFNIKTAKKTGKPKYHLSKIPKSLIQHNQATFNMYQILYLFKKNNHIQLKDLKPVKGIESNMNRSIQASKH